MRHTVIQTRSGLKYDDSNKNKSSYRSFPMVKDIEDILGKMSNDQNQMRDICGSAYQESDYLFRWPDGKLIKPDYVSRHFMEMLRKNGLKQIRFHDLRHTAASSLLDLGYGLQDIKEWLGHSSIQMTSQVYAHISYRRKEDMGEDISAYISKSQKKR